MSEIFSLLSVCIPTYNRSAYLDQCLAALVPQAKAFGIKIHISNNGSTDDTLEVIEKYKSVYSGISSVHQESNIGYDLNHKTVIGMVDTEYAWLLGDDDVILEGSLKKVIACLKDNPGCELLLLNALITDNELHPRGKQFLLNHDVFLDNGNSLLKLYSDKLTFGMMVINAWMFNHVNADKFIGTSHYYGGGVYEYLAINYIANGRNRILIMKDAMVFLRQGERSWSISIGDIAVRQIPEFYFRMHNLYRDNARAAMKRAVGSYRTAFALVRLRADGWLDKEKSSDLMKYYSEGHKLRLCIIANMPTNIAKGLSIMGVFSARMLKNAKRLFFEILTKNCLFGVKIG